MHGTLDRQPSVTSELARSKLMLMLLVVMTGIAPISLYMLVPTLPVLAKTFDSSISLAQMTVSLYMVGLACSQIVMGPLSDRFGRRPVLLAGLGLMGVAKDTYPHDGDTYSFVVGFAEVEVDLETGKTKLIDYLAVGDVGSVVNPRSLHGQILGGINLGIGQPDFPTPAHIVEAGRKALADGHHGYTPANGILPLREAVVADLHRRYKVEVSPAQVLVVPGGKVTMFFAILMFGEPGAEILYPNPGFPIYESVIRFSGAAPVPIGWADSASRRQRSRP